MRLAEIVAESGFHIGTGFAGTALLCDALAATGHHEVAYQLLLTDTCPSWLYPVTMGATTTWERWDSMLPDGTINPGDMTSFNHYAFGAVADYLHRVVGGLAPLDPGYRTFAVAPRPGGGLSHCSTRHDTPYGPARVDWSRREGRLDVTVEVPVGATAVVSLRARRARGRRESSLRSRDAPGQRAVPRGGGRSSSSRSRRQGRSSFRCCSRPAVIADRSTCATSLYPIVDQPTIRKQRADRLLGLRHGDRAS